MRDRRCTCSRFREVAWRRLRARSSSGACRSPASARSLWSARLAAFMRERCAATPTVAGAASCRSAPFTPGETVTVTTSLNIDGGSRGVFRFTVATSAGAVPNKPGISAPRVPGDVLTFHSRPDLRPVAVRVTHRSRTRASRRHLPDALVRAAGRRSDDRRPGDGGLIWFSPVPAGQSASDLRVQRYLGKPVLTWWQGLQRRRARLRRGRDLRQLLPADRNRQRRQRAARPICTSSRSPRRTRR